MCYYAYCLYSNRIKGAHVVPTQLSLQGSLTIIKISILGSSNAKSVISYLRGRFTWRIILMTFIARLAIYMAVMNAVPDLYLLQGSKSTHGEYTYSFCVLSFYVFVVVLLTVLNLLNMSFILLGGCLNFSAWCM
jgi:hypothetical protein